MTNERSFASIHQAYHASKISRLNLMNAPG